MNRKRILCFDFETTGLNFLTDKPIEYAAMSIETDGTVKTIEGFVKYNGVLSDTVKSLTNLTDEILLQKGETYEEAMTKLINFIGIKQEEMVNDVILLGHNMLNFDIHFLDLACATLGYDIVNPAMYWDTAGCYKANKLNLVKTPAETVSQYHKRGLDTFAKGLYFRLPVVCTELGIPFVETHRALSDVEATLRVFRHQAGTYSTHFRELLG